MTVTHIASTATPSVASKELPGTSGHVDPELVQLHAVALHGGAFAGRTVCGRRHALIEPPWVSFEDVSCNIRCPACADRLGLPHG